jgi:tetraprenyl-beta-curcumene synthase
VNGEIARWHELARAIPDRRLATLALATQSGERGNLEGAAVFALLVPRPHRAAVVRAAVSFQALYDFIDTLAEQPASDPLANGRRLHLALLAALDPPRPHADYLEHAASGCDGGYIEAMANRCRESLTTLPSYAAVREPALRAAERMIAYQTLIHDPADAGHVALSGWARGLTPAGSGLRWWETAAGAASSLGVFALIAAAARPSLQRAETDALERAYFPWIGSLHVLLDSLIDRAADRLSGHQSLVENYAGGPETARRLELIAGRALRSADTVRHGDLHALILAAMAGFYLSRPAARAPANRAAGECVLRALGAPARPSIAVLRARRAAGRCAAQVGYLKLK